MSRFVVAFSVVIVAAALFSGCSSPNFNFPSDISGECYRAKDESKVCIMSKGTPLETNKGCTVRKRAGEKKIGGVWCWYETKYWNMYVGGLCYGTLIEVGCNPQTGGEVAYEVLNHEFGHYWLMTNGDNVSHDSLYSSCFRNWREPRASLRATPETLEDIRQKARDAYDSADEGDWISVDGVDENGHQYHFDFIVMRGDS